MPSAQSQAENLRGVDSTTLDPSYVQPPVENRAPSHQPQDTATESPSTEVVSITREDNYIHVEYKSADTNYNVPTVVKAFITQLRRADANVQILPYDADTFLPSDLITNEKDIPTEEAALVQWVKSVETRRKRLCFSIRISSVCLGTLKSIIYAWCKKTSSWTTFVDFRAHQLCSPGWFHGICPYFYNRNDFQSYIERHAPHLKGRILVYKKELYHWDKENGKVTTVCIVIDADLELKHELMSFLRSHKWTERYTGVSFIPHKTNEVYTARHKVEMYKRQNEWASNLKRIIINVSGAQDVHKIGEKSINFQNWLYETAFGGKRVITGVEVAPKKVVRILFHQQHRYDVENIIQNLFKVTSEHFGYDLTSSMLDENALQKLQTTHTAELSHSQKLLQLSANPQSGSDTSQFNSSTNRKTSFHYGTYLDVTKGEHTNTSEITQDDPQTLQELKTPFKN